MYLTIPFAIASLITNLQTTSTIWIRVANTSAYNLHNIKVYSPASGRIDFDSLQPKEKSAYKKVKEAYGLAAAEVTVNNAKIKFLPDDYLGEQFLMPGRYTYELSVKEDKGIKYLRLKLVVDQK
ncbi:MAG: hypothetical protein EBR30_17905 [Cytophagia bacterium]|nr:hypothetical protein [Cytophagia bacterium]